MAMTKARILSSASTFATLALMDVLWLSALYGKEGLRILAEIQGFPIEVRALPALGVYAALTIVHSFAGSYAEAALLGAAVYAVYDLTNAALLTEYPAGFAAVDIAWGAVAFVVAFGVKRLALRPLGTEGEECATPSVYLST